jgi:PAS domain-containing protein
VPRARRPGAPWEQDEIAFACQLADKLALSLAMREAREARAQISDYASKLEHAMRGTLEVVAKMVELRDPYTRGHERRVGDICAAIGAELGLDEERIEGLRVTGGVHDVGKIAAPAEILSKPTRLTPSEYALVKEHAQLGYEILQEVEFPWPVAEVARQHHERLDGSGYPRGLKDGEILLEARILAVADVVEAMSSHRPYRPGIGIDGRARRDRARRGRAVRRRRGRRLPEAVPRERLHSPGIAPQGDSSCGRRRSSGLAELKEARARRSPLRRMLQRLLPYLAALAVLVLCALLLFAVYFTQLELPWVSFLAGVLVAAVIALVTRVSRSEWRVARRAAQLARVRERLAAETERRARAENALAATREKVELIDARLPLPLAYVDAELQLRYHNQAFRERLGLKPAALERGLLPAVLAESGYAELEPAIKAALAGRAASASLARAVAGRTFVVHCVPHAGATGAIGCFIAMTEPAAGAPADAAPGDAEAPRPAPAEERSPAGRARSSSSSRRCRTTSSASTARRSSRLREDGRERLEVLIRLAEEEENMMPPGAFFPVAERYGLMPQLDRWVVEHVLGWVEAGGGRRREGQYFINLAAATVQDESFPAFVREALSAARCPGACSPSRSTRAAPKATSPRRPRAPRAQAPGLRGGARGPARGPRRVRPRARHAHGRRSPHRAGLPQDRRQPGARHPARQGGARARPRHQPHRARHEDPHHRRVRGVGRHPRAAARHRRGLAQGFGISVPEPLRDGA